jgi:cytidylate kinase
MSSQYKLSFLDGKIIAIDGPAGSGKSTTARLLASRLGFTYLDTGAMYRAVTWFALENRISPGDSANLEAVAGKLKIDFRMEGEVNRVYLNGKEITDEIRSPEVTGAVSEVSAHAGVRRAMVALQRKMGEKGNIVAEGRDTTSVVFPDADFKVYLDASLEERARRRMIDFARMKIGTSLNEQMEQLRKRDNLDSGRPVSPLKKTRDSIVIDTTNLSVAEQVERIIRLIKTRTHR